MVWPNYLLTAIARTFAKYRRMFSHTSTTRKGQIAAVVPTYSQAEHRSGKFVTLTVRLSMTVAITISNSSVLKTMTVLGGKLESLTICTVSLLFILDMMLMFIQQKHSILK